ncbi:hypothetical protein [Candidatus Electrothrix sp.]|uniref:hypothetical protein n=1 Tax=Candidatus Electrothrix sp. TaxID=2170559 RepID=UPI004057474B
MSREENNACIADAADRNGSAASTETADSFSSPHFQGHYLLFMLFFDYCLMKTGLFFDKENIRAGGTGKEEGRGRGGR